MMAPWYSGRMPENETTIARVLQSNGYVTGHSGKWHMAIDHKAFPQPEDQGFDFTRHDLGESRAMKPHRLSGFDSHFNVLLGTLTSFCWSAFSFICHF